MGDREKLPVSSPKLGQVFFIDEQAPLGEIARRCLGVQKKPVWRNPLMRSVIISDARKREKGPSSKSGPKSSKERFSLSIRTRPPKPPHSMFVACFGAPPAHPPLQTRWFVPLPWKNIGCHSPNPLLLSTSIPAVEPSKYWVSLAQSSATEYLYSRC